MEPGVRIALPLLQVRGPAACLKPAFPPSLLALCYAVRGPGQGRRLDKQSTPLIGCINDTELLIGCLAMDDASHWLKGGTGPLISCLAPARL